MDAKKIIGVILGIIGLFYLVLPHSVHIASGLALGLSHGIHVLLGIVLIIIAALLIWKKKGK